MKPNLTAGAGFLAQWTVSLFWSLGPAQGNVCACVCACIGMFGVWGRRAYVDVCVMVACADSHGVWPCMRTHVCPCVCVMSTRGCVLSAHVAVFGALPCANTPM